MFNTTLADEYRALAATHGFTRDEIEQLVLNAVRAAFLPPDETAALVASFEAEFATIP
jgi:adenosine deaminase